MTQENNSRIEIPPEVQALLDEASEDGRKTAASFTESSVQLIDTMDGRILREIPWGQAGAFNRNLIRNVMAAGVEHCGLNKIV